jgi:signal transduction histidine kinase
VRLRGKFVGIYALVFCSTLSIVAISVATLYRLERIRDTMDRGNELLDQSRKVRNLTKDIMIGAFAPETYGDLKDVLYFAPFSAAIRQWKEEVTLFQTQFQQFMEDPPLRELVRRGVLGDEHDTAWIMSEKAFARLNGLVARVQALRNAGILGTENLYARIQGSSDPELIALFDETRQTSYYLANSFESYLNYFMDSLEREAAAVRRDQVQSFVIVGVGTALLATLVSLIFSSRIVRRLGTVEKAIARVSAGDFSTPLDFRTRDEFEDLARGFNLYTNALKGNLGAMVALSREAAESALAEERRGLPEEGTIPSASQDRVLRSIVDAALRDMDAAGAAVVVQGPLGIEARVVSGETSFAEEGSPLLAALAALEQNGAPCVVNDGRSTDGTSILAGPLGVANRRFGVLVMSSGERSFNDLDLIRFTNYLEFASLVADNAAKYAELLELRSAEYQALQSQVRPHFLYNVLGSFAALNRMGERGALENSLLALKELLRYSVDHGAETTVAEELDFIERYCELQKMRFQDRLSWRIEREEAALQRRIPKLVLQPLVENAIIHGIEPSGENGTIVIAARLEAGSLILSVNDDGEGFDPAATAKGVGITNVERRLALAFPGATLLLESAPGSGTRSRIEIPEAPPCAS